MAKEKSINGLSNIGLLVAGAALRAAPPKPKEADVKAAIIKKTVGAMPNHLDPTSPRTVDAVQRIVTAAVREAFNAGHANALDQNHMVEELLKQQYKTRTELTLPVAAMAIMEQSGMSSLLLDLDAVATVNDRCRVEMIPDGNYMRFDLRVKGDDRG